MKFLVSVIGFNAKQFESNYASYITNKNGDYDSSMEYVLNAPQTIYDEINGLSEEFIEIIESPYHYMILSDSSFVYEKNSIISADRLIDDYIDCCCNNRETLGTIEWLNKLKENRQYDIAMDFISDAWGLEVEKCCC